MTGTNPEPAGRPRTLGDVRLTTAAALAGFIGVAVGSLGPWITTVLGSADGTRGDGKITLIAAGVGALAVLLDRGSGIGVFFAGLAALAAAATSGYDIVHIERATAGIALFGNRLATAGWGVYITFAGSLIALAALVASAPPFPRVAIWVLAALGALGVMVAGPIRSSVVSRKTTNPSCNNSSVPTVSSISTTDTAASSYSDTTTAPQTSYSDTTTGPQTTQTTDTNGGTGTTSAGGTAPIVNIGPAAGLTSCTQTVSRGAITSCSFAQNVFDAVASYDASNGEIPAHLTVYSPAVSQNFAVSCEIRNQDEVTCTTKTRGLVVFTTNSLGY
jgi:hypothetical protein